MQDRLYWIELCLRLGSLLSISLDGLFVEQVIELALVLRISLHVFLEQRSVVCIHERKSLLIEELVLCHVDSIFSVEELDLHGVQLEKDISI